MGHDSFNKNIKKCITTKEVDRILQNLILDSGQKIVPEKTLIIFDGVQDCSRVINSIKYFRENAPQYHIACAGSLPGVVLAKPSSFPVGKVNFMQIDPMTFMEFFPVEVKSEASTAGRGLKNSRSCSRIRQSFVCGFR